MTWSKRAALAAALVLASAAPSHAQVVGHPWEFSAGAGLMNFDARTYIKDAAAFTGGVGWRWTPGMVLEANGTYSPSKEKLDESVTHNFSYGGLDLRWNLRPAEDRVVPYVLTGAGHAWSPSDSRGDFDATAGSAGLGVLCNLMGNPRHYLRLQVRDVFLLDRTTALVNNVAVTAGFHYVFGGKYKDVDLDGVRDWLDQCEKTPIGAKVTPQGCPTDADGDSVYDGIDKCPDTPRGCKVDKTGCPRDADGDGICDGIDRCPDTPKGATVDGLGCPTDADGDSVYDGIDQCPNTPKGAIVDAKGCPADADGDGVWDGLDKCPDTPKGLEVDATGCLTEMGQREQAFMETGKIRFNVNFETNKAILLDSDKEQIDARAPILAKWPNLKIEVGGHTDETGSAAKNKKLSQDRAEAVVAYLLSKYPAIPKDQLVAKGYGSSMPIAPNTTLEGKAKNRRVEFKVLNLDVFKKEVEERMKK